MRKSDGVRVNQKKEAWGKSEKKSDGVRGPNERKSDGVRVDHKKERRGES